MPVAFVMPCLNEEALVEASAASIGFGASASPAAADVFLVLVDNGSTDGTLDRIGGIASGSREGSVAIIEEPERGYVPPRRRGTVFVEQLAATMGEPPENWLVLQADADTTYLPGYAQWMQQFLGSRRNVLLEGAVKRDAEFDAAYPEYRMLELSVDSALETFAVPDEDEVIVDDKTCGFLLSDYLQWGGHFREYEAGGTEIHAETTRLLLRARLAHGAAKIRVNPAQAIPSRRRIREDPALHFATAGFPRENSWLQRWRARHPRLRNIADFASDPADPEVVEACFYRRAHEIALFWLLPWVVRRAREDLGAPPSTFVAELLENLPQFKADKLAASPGAALEAVLGMIDERPAAFADPRRRRVASNPPL